MVCRIYYQYQLAQGNISGAVTYQNPRYSWPLTHNQVVDIENHLIEAKGYAGGVMLFLNIMPLADDAVEDIAADFFSGLK